MKPMTPTNPAVAAGGAAARAPLSAPLARLRGALALVALGALAAAAAACGDRPPAPASAGSTGSTGSTAASADGASPPMADTADAIPEGPMGESIRRGRAIMLATRESLPDNVGNSLRCTSCHLDEGRRPNSMPWTGVYARFPQYRSRTGRVIRLEDRVNDCLERSLNGSALAPGSDAMRDVVAYMAHLSRGVAVGATVPGQGMARLEPLAPDTTRGRALYASRCVTCHGADGQGTAVAPPLWGAGSYNIGAGMARLNTAAAFIKHNMPFDAPDLTAQQAYDVAAYVNGKPRPDYAGKENDWPNGDPPPDVAYPTRGRRGDAGHR